MLDRKSLKETWNTRANILLWLAGSSFVSHLGCASTPKTPAANPPTSANVGETTIVAIAPAPGAGCDTTLPKFLGLPGLAKGIGGILQRIGSRLLNGLDLTGRFPGLQPQPPVLPLTDPANLEETAPPAVQAAAEIKQEEDAAPQKIMAIRYLATLGCGGCYEKVEDALLEGLNDCTEEVRFEAAKALQCKPECGCKFCSSPTCCSSKVRKKLEELTTCEKEPSARVRRVARLSLACCSGQPLKEDEIPREGPSEDRPGEKSLLANGSPSSNFFDGLQLVSFESLVAPNAAGDMLLASVNGEPIYESQVIPLMMRRTEQASFQSQTQEDLSRRGLMMRELQRVIDWKLLEQAARNEVYPAGTASGQLPLSPEELQLWFDQRVHVDSYVPPQQLSAYYQLHRMRFQIPAKVRWEKVTIASRNASGRENAMEIVHYLRNQALGVGGDPPKGFTREMVHVEAFDWAELPLIQPARVQKTLSSLPVGQLSPAIEEQGEIVLVRVLERSKEDWIPLQVVSEKLQSEIIAERKKAAEVKFLSQLRAQSRIWTVFDNAKNP